MYKKSDEGKACIELFNRESDNYDYENILKRFCTDDEDVDIIVPWVATFFINNDVKEGFIPETLDFDSICDFIENYDLDDYDFDDDDNAISNGKAVNADDDRQKKWLQFQCLCFCVNFLTFASRCCIHLDSTLFKEIVMLWALNFLQFHKLRIIWNMYCITLIYVVRGKIFRKNMICRMQNFVRVCMILHQCCATMNL